MDLSKLSLRIIFLLLPGILSNTIYRTPAGKEEQKDWEDFVDILIFAIVSYGIYGVLISTPGRYNIVRAYVVHSGGPAVTRAALDPTGPIVWYEIGVTCLVGVFVAVMAAYSNTFRLINRFGQWIGATSQFDDRSVWNVYHREYGGEWMFVRDHLFGLVYFGKIAVYSSVGQETRELIIEDVIEGWTSHLTDSDQREPVRNQSFRQKA